MAAFPARGPRSGRAALVAAVAAVSVAAACSGSGFTYHANQEERLYFKVPDDWTVFDNNDFPGGDPGEGMWVRGFVGGASPTFETVFQVESTQPRGYVQIEPLDVMERDTLNIASLRGTNLGTDRAGNPLDPLIYAQENPDGELQVLGYDDTVVLDHGPHGVRIRVAITLEGSLTTAIIDQTVLVDAATSKRYVLSIGCSAACFEEHERQIEEVIESWTLEAK